MVCNSKRIFKLGVALKKAMKFHPSLNAYVILFKYNIENNWEEDKCMIRICPWIYSRAKDNKPSMNPN